MGFRDSTVNIDIGANNIVTMVIKAIMSGTVETATWAGKERKTLQLDCASVRSWDIVGALLYLGLISNPISFLGSSTQTTLGNVQLDRLSVRSWDLVGTLS